MISHQDPGLAVVFDLDGTLIDSVGDIVGAANRLLAEEGRAPVTLDAGRAMVGEGAAALVERAFAATGPAPTPEALTGLVERYRAIYERHPIDYTTVFPGVVESLVELAEGGAILGVCTNKPHDISLVVLAELGLAGHFSAALGGDALAVLEHHAVGLDALDRDVGPGLDAEGLKRITDHRHRLLPHVGADMGLRIDQDHARLGDARRA